MCPIGPRTTDVPHPGASTLNSAPQSKQLGLEEGKKSGSALVRHELTKEHSNYYKHVVIIGNHGNHQICFDTHSVITCCKHKYLKGTIYDAMYQNESTTCNKYDFLANPQLLYTFGLTRNKQEPTEYLWHWLKTTSNSSLSCLP